MYINFYTDPKNVICFSFLLLISRKVERPTEMCRNFFLKLPCSTEIMIQFYRAESIFYGTLSFHQFTLSDIS